MHAIPAFARQPTKGRGKLSFTIRSHRVAPFSSRCPRFPFAVTLPPPFPVSLLVESGEKKRNEIKRTRLAKECVLDHGGLLENRRKSEFVFQRSDTRVRLKTRRVKGDVNRGEKSEGKRHGEEGDFRRRKRR